MNEEPISDLALWILCGASALGLTAIVVVLLGGCGGGVQIAPDDAGPPCTYGALECAGASVRQCSADASWSPYEVCPYACIDGVGCTGVCAQGSSKPGATCNPCGHWVPPDTAACH